MAGREAELLAMAAAQAQLEALLATERQAAGLAEGEPAAGKAVAVDVAREEGMQRLAVGQAELVEAAQLQRQHMEELKVLAVARAECLEVEQQETMERLLLGEEQLAFAMGLAAGLPSLAGRLAEAQSAMQVSRMQVSELEERLEEREVVLAQVERELEAVQDAQVSSDVEAQQRQLGWLEGERRAAILAEQRAAWGMMQEIARGSQMAVVQHAVERLELVEAVERQAIAEEQAGGLDVGSMVQQLRLLLAKHLCIVWVHSLNSYICALACEALLNGYTPPTFFSM